MKENLTQNPNEEPEGKEPDFIFIDEEANARAKWEEKQKKQEKN